MRRTYKPPSRRSKIYRRKTLDPKSRLDIRRDEDDLENIDDYWKTAESVLRDDSVAEIEETAVYRSEDECKHSDTLFDIKGIRERLSIKQSCADLSTVDADTFELSSIATNSVLEKMDPSVLFENITADHNVIADDGFESLCTIKAENSKYLHGGSICKHSISDEDDSAIDARIKARAGPGMNLIDAKVEEIAGDMQNKNAMESQRCKVARSIISPEAIRECTENIEFASEYPDYAIANALGIYQGKSSFEPLITSLSITTGILFLKSLASVNPEHAACGFSMFVIKGAVQVCVDNQKLVLKKGGVCVIEKDTRYCISNPFATRCTILLTHASSSCKDAPE
ncbi:hypothetical protein HK407_03g05910 [Ordospora pajunii]|uniref:uncharacterized protein n=1 Tax=Ordospora pajunii TaxID=3039483 RepID=UPI00295270B8|nr:uncharacterized protein HK407_03g05910 [Ordospora pajunii]KAH9411839.1 hypothetical protein HK407_03g05910 [Ordospora pajunii]